jgi:hypothetical protein
MASNNNDIPRAWAAGQAAKNHRGSFTTDGRSIWSYNLCIGETLEDGRKILHDYTADGIRYYSQTTSCHVGKCRSVADLIRTRDKIVSIR